MPPPYQVHACILCRLPPRSLVAMETVLSPTWGYTVVYSMTWQSAAHTYMRRILDSIELHDCRGVHVYALGVVYWLHGARMHVAPTDDTLRVQCFTKYVLGHYTNSGGGGGWHQQLSGTEVHQVCGNAHTPTPTHPPTHTHTDTQRENETNECSQCDRVAHSPVQR